MSNGVVYLAIPFEGDVSGNWENVFFKIIVLLDGYEIRKEVFSEFSYCIERNLEVFVEILEIQISFPFEFYLDEEIIKSW